MRFLPLLVFCTSLANCAKSNFGSFPTTKFPSRCVLEYASYYNSSSRSLISTNKNCQIFCKKASNQKKSQRIVKRVSEAFFPNCISSDQNSALFEKIKIFLKSEKTAILFTMLFFIYNASYTELECGKLSVAGLASCC